MDMKHLLDEIATGMMRRSLMLVTAESCTGGGVAQAITSVPGSSGWFDRGFVTYSNCSKVEMLGVSEERLAQYGAVSEPVVRAMAEGALQRSHAQLSLAISGIAGPGGGSKEKPVGTILFAWAAAGKDTDYLCEHFAGDRQQLREQAVGVALQGVWRRLRAW